MSTARRRGCGEEQQDAAGAAGAAAGAAVAAARRRWAAWRLHDWRARQEGLAAGVAEAAWAVYLEMLDASLAAGPAPGEDYWPRWCAAGCTRMDPHGGAGAGYGRGECEVMAESC